MGFHSNPAKGKVAGIYRQIRNENAHYVNISIKLLFKYHITRVTYVWDVWAGITQSVLQLGTGWTVRGSNPGGSEFFYTRPDRPWGPPSLIYYGYQVFPGVKEAGKWL